MKKNYGLMLSIGLISGTAIFQVLLLIEKFSSNIAIIDMVTISYISYAYYVALYLAIALLIWIEIDHLDEFHIDKFALIGFIFSSIFRRRLGIKGEDFFLVLIGLTGILTMLVLIKKKPKILRSSIQWALVGVAIGGIVIIPIGLLEMLFRHTWFIPPLYQGNLFLTTTRQLLYELSFAAILEEFLIRGFLCADSGEIGHRFRMMSAS